MKILLIEPTLYTPSGLRKDALYKDSMRASCFLALTLPYLAGLTPREIEVKLAYDVCEDIENDYDLASFDLIGITSQTIHLKRTLELARHIKKLGRPVVVGGPATIENGHQLVPILARFCAAVVIGEAEELWLQVIHDFEKGSLKKIYQSDKVLPFSGLPIPRFDLVNFDFIAKPHILPSLTTRGCPRACTFCSEFLYSPWRVRPVDEVITELAAYKAQFGISRVLFRDDNFLVHPGRSQELLRKMLPLDLEWGCQTDLNLARHPDLVELAVNAGMRFIALGLESIEEANREAVHKSFFTTTEADELLQLLHERGVETQVNIIFGFDADTPDIFDKTVNFLIRGHVSRFVPDILFPVPGTPVYQQLLEENRLINVRPPGVEEPLYVGYTPKQLTAEGLVSGCLHAQRRFEQEKSSPVFWLGEEKHIWTREDGIG